MLFARRRHVDLCLSAAARRLMSVGGGGGGGGGGARLSAARRRRRGVLRLLTPISHFQFTTFLQFYQYKSAFYLLFNRQAYVK
jgi:hypothetical protein